MAKVFSIVVTDLRIFFADRGNLIQLVLMPIALALFLGYALGADGGPSFVRVDVIDRDQSEHSEQFLESLRALNNTLLLCPVDNDEDNTCQLDGLEDAQALTVEQSLDRVESGQTTALIVIPDGYGADVESFDPVEIEYYSREDVTSGEPILQSVQAVVQRVNAAIIAAQVGTGVAEVLTDFDSENEQAAYSRTVYENARETWAQINVTVRYVLSEEGEVAQQIEPTGFNQSVPGMATMYVMLTLFTGIGLLLRERKQWTLQRLIVMPISRAQLLGGKILARFMLGVIEFVVVFTVGVLVGVSFGSNPVALLLIIVAYTLCITALSFAIAPFVRTEAQAGSLATLLGLVLAALGGAWWPLEIAPNVMQVVGHLSPVAWAMDGFAELTTYGGGLSDVLLPVAVLLAAAAVLFGIAIMQFRYET